MADLIILTATADGQVNTFVLILQSASTCLTKPATGMVNISSKVI